MYFFQTLLFASCLFVDIKICAWHLRFPGGTFCVFCVDYVQGWNWFPSCQIVLSLRMIRQRRHIIAQRAAGMWEAATCRAFFFLFFLFGNWWVENNLSWLQRWRQNHLPSVCAVLWTEDVGNGTAWRGEEQVIFQRWTDTHGITPQVLKLHALWFVLIKESRVWQGSSRPKLKTLMAAMLHSLLLLPAHHTNWNPSSTSCSDFFFPYRNSTRLCLMFYRNYLLNFSHL